MDDVVARSLMCHQLSLFLGHLVIGGAEMPSAQVIFKLASSKMDFLPLAFITRVDSCYHCCDGDTGRFHHPLRFPVSRRPHPPATPDPWPQLICSPLILILQCIPLLGHASGSPGYSESNPSLQNAHGRRCSHILILHFVCFVPKKVTWVERFFPHAKVCRVETISFSDSIAVIASFNFVFQKIRLTYERLPGWGHKELTLEVSATLSIAV